MVEVASIYEYADQGYDKFEKTLEGKLNEGWRCIGIIVDADGDYRAFLQRGEIKC